MFRIGQRYSRIYKRMCSQQQLRSACASAQSDQSSLPYVEALGSWLSTECLTKTDQTLQIWLWLFYSFACYFVGFAMARLFSCIATSFVHTCLAHIYRRLSLSQSPENQTKYFELSVVWDSQFVTSFTLYMYMDCLGHCDYNLHVHVFGNDMLEFKYPLTELLTLILRRLWQKLKNVNDYLHQRMLLNSVQLLRLQRRRYVQFGCCRTHLTAWLCWLLALLQQVN